MQYLLPSERPRINELIEDSILEAERKGAKVIGLGLLNKVFHTNDIFCKFVWIIFLLCLIHYED